MIVISQERFDDLILKFNQFLEGYSYQVFQLEDREYVYFVEQSIILHLSIRSSHYGRLVIEEIFNDNIYNIRFKDFEKQIGGSVVQYFRFNGILGYSSPFIQSQYERVNALLPELEIDKRYEEWPGMPCPCLVFELTEGDKTGYAIFNTTAKQTIQKVMELGKTLFLACVSAPNFDDLYERTGQTYALCGVERPVWLERNMKDIIMGRLQSPNASDYIKKNYPSNSLGIEEKGMKYYWITPYVKTNEGWFNGTLIDDIKNGKYSDIEKYEYVLPENKWKSEQLVYELTSQIYPKYKVLYQYRPYFLNSGKGQMSYDIYISQLKVAIEYQGKQHFEPVEIFGGEESYKRQVERDSLKMKLSKDHGIKLVYINYWDDITADLIKSRIESDE